MTLSTETMPVARPTPTDPPARAAVAVPRFAVPARLRRTLLTAVPLVALLLLWHLLTANQVVFWLRFDKIPTPGEVFDALKTQSVTASYYRDILSSTRRILLGFGLATVGGVLVGMAIGRSPLVSALVRPVLEVFRPIPAIALVPLAILLFPTGEQGIVFITTFAAFFPVAVSTIHAMHALPKVWEEAARTLGARRREILFRIALPGALPGIFSGLSVAMGVAWICVISAEMISGQFGIGYFTWQSYGLLDYASVMVGMLTIGVLGWVTAWLVEMAGRRVNRWLPRAAR
ncbi:ABC transporter permease [Nocardia arizonensis]|uniref:ABC transporter permease n=1 Tax=Nocardia arizonensis TaxID=1141647 RepID=UPI0006D1D19B|nr:ABC transporter permease [Nocardia arizonensis]